MTDRIPAADFIKRYQITRAGRAIRKPGAEPDPAPQLNPKPHKYHARPTFHDSPIFGPVLYASKAEAKRAREIDVLHAAGEVLWAARQVRFVLDTTPEGRPIHYVADFLLAHADGRIEVEDVKGMKLPIYALKRAGMLRRHGIVVREIGR